MSRTKNWTRQSLASLYSVDDIHIGFKDYEDLRKNFHRQSVKQLAEYILSNSFCEVVKERSPGSDSVEYQYYIRLVGLNLKDPNRIKIPGFGGKNE